MSDKPTAPSLDGGPKGPEPATPDPKLDRTFYTWSTMFRGVLGLASKDEIRSYNAVWQDEKKDSLCRKCEDRKDWLMKYSPIVRFMREQCRMVGADIKPENIVCRPCESGSMQGGFDPNYGIVLCSNEGLSKRETEDTIAHEMVHAYDWLRFKIDQTNPQHIACAEIRASMLSGECRFTREFWDRKQYRLVRQFQDCVRRRATLSLAKRMQQGPIEPSDPVMKKAGDVVDSVWDSCFTDTRPFDEIYR